MRRFTNLETQPIQTLGYVCILVVTLIFLSDWFLGNFLQNPLGNLIKEISFRPLSHRLYSSSLIQVAILHRFRAYCTMTSSSQL